MPIVPNKRIWVLIGLGWVIFIALTFAYFALAPSGGHDSDAYYFATQHLLRGENPYGALTGRAYLYPPLLAQLFIPFAWVQSQTLYEISLYISFIGALVICIIILVRHFPPQWAKWLWLMPIGFYPIWEQLFFGQISIWLCLCFVLAWDDYHAGRYDRAGAWLAVATWIKLYPVIVIGLFVLRRDWRVVRGALIIGVILGIIQTFMAGGFAIWSDFLNTLIALAGEGREGATFENHSIFGFASRLFLPNSRVYPIILNEILFIITRWGLTFLMVGMSLYVIMRSQSHDERATFDLSYGMVIILGLLGGTVLWFSAMTPLLLIYPLIIWHYRTRLSWVILAISYIGSVFVWLIYHSAPTLPALTLSWGTFGMMGLWGVCVWAILRTNRSLKSKLFTTA